MGRNFVDFTGQIFGRLTVIEKTDRRSNGSIVWKCKCDCGNETFVRSSSLRNESTQSCGCLNKERVTTHGMRHTSEYRSW